MKRRRKQKMAGNYVTLNEAIAEFFREKKAENITDSTYKTYTLHIKHFLQQDDLFEGNLPTKLVTVDFYQDWIEDMQNDENKKDTTVTSYCRSIRVLLYWMMDKGYIDDYPLVLPKCENSVKVCYTQDELTTLLKKPDDNCSEVEYQTWVYINLICATGLRLSSALNLKVKDLVAKDRELYVQHTKNKQGQLLYLNDEMIKILNKYFQQFDLFSEDYMFCTAGKTRLARRTIQDNVATYNRKRGVEKTSIHLMRHTFAKNYYQKTKDIYSLRMILGHSSVGITENYLKDLGLTLESAIAYNPQQIFVEQNQPPRRRRGRMKK